VQPVPVDEHTPQPLTVQAVQTPEDSQYPEAQVKATVAEEQVKVFVF
jgi:hypothetical protein